MEIINGLPVVHHQSQRSESAPKKSSSSISNEIQKINLDELDDLFNLEVKIQARQVKEALSELTESKYCGSDDNCTGCGCNTCCSSC